MRGIKSEVPKKFTVRKLSRAAWIAIGKKLFGEKPMAWRFRCVSCGHSQSGQELVDHCGLEPDKAMNAVYFNCEGRFTPTAGAALTPEKGKLGCDWSLGGLFTIHRLAILDPETKSFRPVFEFDHPEAEALVIAAELAPRVHPTSEVLDWAEYEWPAWIPANTRAMVMSSHHASPKAWLAECAKRDMPPLGEEVTVRDGGVPYTGRVVFLSNDCVRIVHADGDERTTHL